VERSIAAALAAIGLAACGQGTLCLGSHACLMLIMPMHMQALRLDDIGQRIDSGDDAMQRC
jgi:hypothetical protein